MWGAPALGLGALPACTHKGVVSLTNKPHTASFFASYNLRHKATARVPTGRRREREKAKGRQGLLPATVQRGQSANDGRAPPGTLQLELPGIMGTESKVFVEVNVGMYCMYGSM